MRSPGVVAARGRGVAGRVGWPVGLLLAAWVALPGRGTAQEAAPALYPPRARRIAAEAAGGTVGAAGGMVAGVGLVLLVHGEPRGVDLLDGTWVAYTIMGAMTGSIGGGTLGSHLGARLAGGRGGRWSDRALRQAAGFAVGLLVAGQITKHTADPGDFTIVASMTVTQGVVAALSGSRER